MDTKADTTKRRGSNRGFFVGLLLGAGLRATSASGTDYHQLTTDPIPTGNRISFVGIQGLPSAQSAYLLPHGRTKLTLHADATNTSITEGTTGGRRTVIDGETHRIEIDVRRGLADRWELGVTLPLLRHSGGFLDRPIERWHRIFGLPNSNRDRLPRDRLLFSQSSADGTDFQLDNTGGGVGDLQLSASRQLREGLALRSMLKLPTGSGDRLTGSDATAFAGALHAGGSLSESLHWHASGGLLITGDGNVLPDRRENLLAFGSATLAWQVTRDWVLKSQLDGHTAAYRNTGKPLDRGSLQLSIAAAFALSDNWALEFGFTEDIAVETAPDVVFHAGLRHQF